MLIDTHAHLNFSAFKDDLDEVIKRCFGQKVGVVNVGSQYSTSERAVTIAEKYENMFAAIGLHPIHLEFSHIREKIDEDEEFEFDTRNEKFDAEKYRKLAKSKKVVAIGETGIDLFHNPHNLKEQTKTFKEEIDLAMELGLPVVVHCRKAYPEVLEILKEKKKDCGEKLRGVVHSYMGKYSLAPEFIKLGFMLGFNGVITFARDYDRVIKEIDLENMLIETDCPYLTPDPFRGKRNEPTYVRYVAEKIGEIKNVNFEEVTRVTAENTRKLFGI
jgi:TatD DNase family protein